MASRMFTNRSRGLFLPVIPLLLTVGIRAEDGDIALRHNLSTAQIVERMEQHEQARQERLRHYEAVRHYEVEYRDFSRTLTARMDVEPTYDASSGKKFRILSQSGSKALCDGILKRAVESELEASHDRSLTAMSPVNYTFQFAGLEKVGNRPAYILDVQPVHKNKFLFRGRVWVDASDFAVARIEAQPARNPSFWVSRTTIRYTNAKMGGFWLPKHSRSESKVRIGGTAVMTIDYGSYEIEPKSRQAAISH